MDIEKDYDQHDRFHVLLRDMYRGVAGDDPTRRAEQAAAKKSEMATTPVTATVSDDSNLASSPARSTRSRAGGAIISPIRDTKRVLRSKQTPTRTELPLGTAQHSTRPQPSGPTSDELPISGSEASSPRSPPRKRARGRPRRSSNITTGRSNRQDKTSFPTRSPSALEGSSPLNARLFPAQRLPPRALTATTQIATLFSNINSTHAKPSTKSIEPDIQSSGPRRESQTHAHKRKHRHSGSSSPSPPPSDFPVHHDNSRSYPTHSRNNDPRVAIEDPGIDDDDATDEEEMISVPKAYFERLERENLARRDAMRRVVREFSHFDSSFLSSTY